LEVEVVDLRKKVEKSNTHIKFMNNSTILNEILDSQRSPNDKSGLGYNKEATHLDANTSKKHEVSPSFSNNVSSQPSTQRKKTLKRTKQGRHQEAIFTPQSKFRRETPSRWTPKERYENVFMVIASHVMNMVTKIWIADITQENMLEGFITP
jgi:hypothetical protein